MGKQIDVNTLEAGRELNLLIADRFFNLVENGGQGVSPHEPKSGVTWDVDLPLRNYSGDISEAWPLAERFEIGVLPWEGGYAAGFESTTGHVAWFERILYGEKDGMTWAFAETAPLAICRAAVLKSEIEKQSRSEAIAGEREMKQ